MDKLVNRVDVWTASIADKPGGLSRTLKGVFEAGADLDFVIARRAPDEPGMGAVFITPIRGDREIEAASTLADARSRAAKMPSRAQKKSTSP